MKIVLLGATGMVGRGVLLEALDDQAVTAVLTLGRSKTGESHPTLREIDRADLFDLTPILDDLRGYDGCISSLGVSAVGMSEAEYTRLTYDLTIAIAKAFLAASPGGAFVYVTGQGTDSTESGRQMWARVKGRTENALLAMPFGSATMFRPGVIKPERGIRSRTKLYNALYTVLGPLVGLLARAGVATTTTLIGQAMLEAVEHPPAERILDNAAINALGKRRLERRGASGDA
jgi:uncharacterized protein YbjT (DUF2867 family)